VDTTAAYIKSSKDKVYFDLKVGNMLKFDVVNNRMVIKIFKKGKQYTKNNRFPRTTYC